MTTTPRPPRPELFRFADALVAAMRATPTRPKVTQEELGDRVGVSRQAVSEWVNAKAEPGSASRVREIETALGLESGTLYRLLPDPETEPGEDDEADTEEQLPDILSLLAGRLDDATIEDMRKARDMIDARLPPDER